MKQIKGIWLPDDDTHFKDVIEDDGSYQKKQFNTALEFIKPEDRGLFIDVGAHVGLWSRMAVRAGFDDILAFEPNKESADCFRKNVLGDDINLEEIALSNKEGEGAILLGKPSNSGSAYLSSGNDFKLTTFDSFGFWYEIKKKILIKIDVQGHELEVIEGMQEFIKRYKPFIIVEQMLEGKWDKRATDFCKYLGMKILRVIEKEIILGW